jgi:hypothetical protein
MTTKTNSSSVVDVPRQALDEDQFGIEKYKNGLIRFIENSETPITIAIQGEWGSGKTSLMNSLNYSLCGESFSSESFKNHVHPFYGVWINTWQYSLMRSQEETLISIVVSITTKIVEIIDARHKSKFDHKLSRLLNFSKNLAKGLAGTAANQIAGEGSSDLINSLLEREREGQTISQLRDELENVINSCLELDAKNNNENLKKGFIFFIDDLDRIDPPVAVQILELLKNIFDIKNCLFILAIDYDVVIKGLKPKFGELTDKNEREFRSFFDKIIQMPFSMPVATYSIDRFLIDNLQKIGYLDNIDIKDISISEKLSMICNLSVGSNPRSLKRLLNTISLITIINTEDSDSEYNEIDSKSMLINFGLICIQIAYPLIYRALSVENDFKKWNEGIATKLKLRALDPIEIEKLSKSEEFDEEWEQVVFRICEKDIYLSNRVSQISQLLNILGSLIPEGKNLGEVIEETLELSAVTDIQAFDKPKQAINKGSVLKILGTKLIPLLSDRLKPPFPAVRQQSKKVQTNFFIAYSKPEEGHKDIIGLSISQNKDSLNLMIWTHPWAFAVKSNNLRQDLNSEGMLPEFEEIAKGFDGLEKLFPNFKSKYPGINSTGIGDKKWHVPHLTFELDFSNPQELYEIVKLNIIADFITDFMQQYSLLSQFSKRYNERVQKGN